MNPITVCKTKKVILPTATLNLHEKPFAELPPRISSATTNAINTEIITNQPFHPIVVTQNQISWRQELLKETTIWQKNPRLIRQI